MRVGLGKLDASELAVDLGRGEDGEPQQVQVKSARGLTGTLEQAASVLSLDDVKGEWIELASLGLTFGTTRLTTVGDATLGQASLHLKQGPEGTLLSLDCQSLHAHMLGVDVASVSVRGELRLAGAKLRIDGGNGSVFGAQAHVESFFLRIGDMTIEARELSAVDLLVGWGATGFRLEASELSGPAVTLKAGKAKLDAQEMTARALTVHGANVRFKHAAMKSAQLEVSFDKGEEDAPTPKEAETKQPMPRVSGEKERPVFDFEHLDGMSGSLHVNAVVDMTLPIIGQRTATHKLRLGVEEGTIDYRELESGLSSLEGSILDFSVRDGALVLERGIPLLPTRGFGKRLFFWELSPADLALANKRRVRMSVLPKVRMASDLEQVKKEKEKEKSSSSSFALRRLGLEDIDLRLALRAAEKPRDSVIELLTFDRLSATGNIQHEMQGTPRRGVVDARFDNLATRVSGLKLGASTRMDVHSLTLSALREAKLTFLGLSPDHLRVAIDGLTVQGLAFESE